MDQNSSSIIMLIVMLAIMYAVLIIPQKKRDKKYRSMIAALKVGDDIVTIGGIIGKISNIKDDTITIEVGADKTKLKMEKSSIKVVISSNDESK